MVRKIYAGARIGTSGAESSWRVRERKYLGLGIRCYCMPNRLSATTFIFINVGVSVIITISVDRFRNAPVAQLDRASGYEPEGREFESLRAHHFPLEP